MTEIIENPDTEESEPQVPDEIIRMFGMHFKHMSGPPWLAVADKITSDHITTVLGHFGKSQENDHIEGKGARWERVAYVSLGVIVFLFLTIFVMPRDTDTYKQMLQWLGIFSAGGVGGYGIGLRRGRHNN